MEEFNAHFLEIHPDFYQKLWKDFPTLNPNEIKLCAYFSLNLTNKEIALVAHKNEHSVKIARHRLRKKLQLDNKENLTLFLLKY